MPKKSTNTTLLPTQLVTQRFQAAGISGRELSRKLGLTPVAWAQMCYRGVIPNQRNGSNYNAELLKLAKEHGVKLTAEELINGGKL